MNTSKLCSSSLALLAFASFAVAANDSKLSDPAKTPWQATKRTANQTHWESITIHTNRATQRLLIHTNSYVEIGSAINIRDATGSFVRADPSFHIVANGATANGTAHKVQVPGDIWLGNGIEVTKPDGEKLVFQPLGIDYFDPSDGRSLLLDAVTNAVGYLVASNEIVYSNCLTQIKGSIRVRNLPWGIESDLILEESPPDPAAMGLTSAARLEMLTEQFDGPSPTARPNFIHRESDPTARASMVAPDFIDSELSFAGMQMVSGRAFGTSRHTNTTMRLPTPVGKSFTIIQQRRILIEAVEHRDVLPVLNELPGSTNVTGITNAALKNTMNRNIGAMVRNLPSFGDPFRRGTDRATRTASIRRVQRSATAAVLAAAAKPEPPSFVLDYQLLNENGETNLTLRGDSTYFVNNLIPLYGVTTVQGGAIVKMVDGAKFLFQSGSTLVCDTTNSLPAVFTSMDDDTVGEIVEDSGGTPYQVYATAFEFNGGTHEVRNIRCKHIRIPVSAYNGADVTLRNVQFLDSTACLWTYGTLNLSVFNALAQDFGWFYRGDTPTFRGEHLTLRNGIVLGYANSTSGAGANVKNSIFVALQQQPTHVGTVTTSAVFQASSATGIFQTVEAGGHYLPVGSTLRSVVGITDIDSTLKKDLAQATTFAPTVLTGTPTSDLTLSPLVLRDTNTIGYHYPIIDYLAKDLVFQNTTVNLVGGVVLATAASGWSSIWLNPAKLVSVGTPTQMNKIIRANQIQENAPARFGTILTTGYSDATKAELSLRFTDISSLAGEEYLFYLSDFSRLQACHNSFFNGWIGLSMYGGIYQTVGLTNNLVRSVAGSFWGNSPVYFHAYNNLFKDGSLGIWGANSSWHIYDNIFDHMPISDDGGPEVEIAARNAYIATTNQLSYDGDAIPLTSLGYASGPLGRYYLAGTVLRNMGSRTVSAAGLFHFTTQTDQAKDTLAVDIGLHYVAVSSLGLPLDTDWDGLADYLEDINGNGTQDTGETVYTNPDTDGDGLADGIDLFPLLINSTPSLGGVLKCPLP